MYKNTIIVMLAKLNFKNKLRHIIENFEQYFELAHYANNMYYSYLHEVQYKDEFCLRLKNILHN